MKIKTLFSAVLIIAISSISASAKPGKGDKGGEGLGHGKKNPAIIFAAIDANSDGQIVTEELADSKRFKDAAPERVAAAFAQKDQNDDGSISEEEFIATFKGDKRRGKGRKGGEKGGRNGRGGERSE